MPAKIIKQERMKTRIILLMCLLTGGTLQAQEYLREVLDKLESIRSASYQEERLSYLPYESKPRASYTYQVHEYRNPNDTTIGSSFVEWTKGEKIAHRIYDGRIQAYIDQEPKEVEINDFSMYPFPYRPVSAPFFNYTESLLRYFRTSSDSITREVKDMDSLYYVKMVIHEPTQIEFFGRAYRMPQYPFITDPTSQYEVWIDKKTDLPCRMMRSMSHDKSESICSNVELNGLEMHALRAEDYFPEGYTVRKIGEKKPKELPTLEGKRAPSWTLTDAEGNVVSLDSLKSKVILLNLTGIGCGACHASLPFLRTLKDRFSPEDFELVAIETWGNSRATLQSYAKHNGIQYKFLEGNDKVVTDYHTGGAAPFFFLIDQDRIVRKVIRGYSIEDTDKEIINAIEGLLAK